MNSYIPLPNFEAYLETLLLDDPAYSNYKVKLLCYCGEDLQDFLLYTYNRDMGVVIGLENANPYFNAKKTYNMLNRRHKMIASCIIKAKDRNLLCEFPPETMNFLKKLPFDFLTITICDLFLANNFNTFDATNLVNPRSSAFDVTNLANPQSKSSLEPETYFKKLLGEYYLNLDVEKCLTNEHVYIFLLKIIEDMKHENPNLELYACKGILPLFLQLLYIKYIPQEIEKLVRKQLGNFDTLIYLESFELRNLWLTYLLVTEPSLTPLLEIGKGYSFEINQLPLEAIDLLKSANNLKYTNSQIIKILARSLNLDHALLFENKSADSYLYPNTSIQNLLYICCLGFLPFNCENTTLHENILNVLSGLAEGKDLEFPSITSTAHSERLFTPTQINNFLLENPNIQNELLRDLDELGNTISIDVNKFEITLREFYKTLYTYYCGLNHLNPQYVYIFKDEVKSYNNYILATKLNRWFSNLPYLQRLHGDFYLDMPLNSVSKIQLQRYYVDINYNTEFLNDLRTVNSDVVDEVYKAYLIELLNPIYNNAMQHLSDIDKDENFSIRVLEEVINGIPHHFVRCMLATTFQFNRDSDYTLDVILNHLFYSPASLSLLECLSYVALTPTHS